MAQHDYNIANAGGATVRADINNVLAAVQSLNSGTGAPSSTVAGMLWLDTSGGLPYALKIRDGGNNHWLTIASVTDPGADGNIETSATILGTIKGTIDSTASFPTKSANSGNTSAGGHILQVQQKVKRDIFSTDSVNDTFTAIPGLDVKITPSSDTSKILVSYQISIAMEAGSHSGVATALYRGGSIVTNATASSTLSSQEAVTTVAIHYNADDVNVGSGVVSIQYLDSPGVNTELTYQPYLFNASGSAFRAFVNRTQSENNEIYVTRGASFITAMEIA